MTRRSHPARPVAFTIIELLVVIAVIALLVAILLPALAAARRSGRTSICNSNLHQEMVAYHSYAMTSKDAIAALGYTDKGVLIDGVWHAEIHAHKATADLARKLIIDNTDNDPGGWVQAGGFVIEQYSHLVLTEHFSESISPVTVCPEDRPRLSWRDNPLGMSGSAFKPGLMYDGSSKAQNKDNLNWWPYSTSYHAVPWMSIRERRRNPGQSRQTYVQASDSSDHDKFRWAPRSKPGNFRYRTMQEVAFPSQKVAVYDTQQRHVGKSDLFFAFKASAQPLAFFDGSVSFRKTIDANPGQNPESDVAGRRCGMRYRPDAAFESPIPSGFTEIIKEGFFRWTSGDLGGVDFGGKEVRPEKL